MTSDPKITPRIFHGAVTPQDFAAALLSAFNRGNYKAQQLGEGNRIHVQIATLPSPGAGGQTALTLSMEKHADGVTIKMGKQAWYGIAASLGITALTAWKNPWNLLSRLDDIAQDVEHMQLSEHVWNTIEDTARLAGASFELSERLRRLLCAYCDTPNPTGEASCLACGAPLGSVQPQTCSRCGYVIKSTEHTCPNCGVRLA